jgi:hypothetical protein
MQADPVREWQRLQEHYRQMLDEELLELAEEFGNLTEMAQQVLQNELATRKLDKKRSAAQTTPERTAVPRFASTVDPEDLTCEPLDVEAEEDEEDAPARDYTWKTPLCDCETTDEAWQLKEALKRAGIDSWVEGAGSRWGGSQPRVVVAADQLDQAREIASRPIPQEIVEESQLEIPEYELPTCPRCSAPDPVLESVEPTNSWLCESCGAQWTDAADNAEEK